ncbi:maleylacetate reductase [Bordetella sputigena]|uniref:maleylacetate reductase n=1 Tax=Bordetella sputigena TaxID=1416810 RepID=UPI0039EECC08
MKFSTPGGVYNATPARVVFARGAIDGIAEEVDRLGARRALIVTTPGRAALGDRVASLLGDRCAGLWPEAVSQVPIELARVGRQAARDAGADCIVSAGGGAAIGLGKGISLELGLPIVAIPTTYSGSEVTGFCGITIDGVKRMHTSLNMLASTVVYDPELTLGLPADISAASAMNALAHCVDAIYVPTVDPVTALAAVEGARVIARAAPRVIARPGDIEARSELLYGAYLGGVALTGGFALQHGLAHVLGGSFNIAHGLSHTLVLPYVAHYNSAYAPEPLGRLGAAIGAAGSGAAGPGAAGPDETGIGAAIHDLATALDIRMGLTGTGLDRAALHDAARITIETDDGQNPGPVTEDVVRRILEAAWEGERPV